MGKYVKILDSIIKEYENQGIIFIKTNDPRSYCFPAWETVVLYEKIYERANIEDLFDVLHEIGHIKANKKGMLRWQEEASATQWAINKCKELEVNVPEKIKCDFNKYIDEWILFAKKHKSKNIPTKDAIVLKW